MGVCRRIDRRWGEMEDGFWLSCTKLEEDGLPKGGGAEFGEFEPGRVDGEDALRLADDGDGCSKDKKGIGSRDIGA